MYACAQNLNLTNGGYNIELSVNCDSDALERWPGHGTSGCDGEKFADILDRRSLATIARTHLFSAARKVTDATVFVVHINIADLLLPQQTLVSSVCTRLLNKFLPSLFGPELLRSTCQTRTASPSVGRKAMIVKFQHDGNFVTTVTALRFTNFHLRRSVRLHREPGIYGILPGRNMNRNKFI